MMEKIEFSDLKSQYIDLRQQINQRIQQVLDHGQYIMGPEVQELEDRLSRFTESKNCITVASGTEALLIALMALEIKPGDEVIPTPFTFVATAEVIVLLGAVPVLVDIEVDTCNINTSLIESAITDKTKAIIAVSLYGQPSDMDEINDIAARNGNIPVIEDAAQSFGASYKNKKSCNLSTIGCTSFFPSKPLGCYGDGGAIFTNDDLLAKIMREIRVHGQERRYYHTRIGVGGRMDTLQCAIVLAKLENFNWEVNARITAGEKYNNLLSATPHMQLLKVHRDRVCVCGQVTIQVENRESVLANFKEAKIPVSVHHPIPLHRQPAYKDLVRIVGKLKNSETASNKVMSLPMHAYITEDIQEYIASILDKDSS